MRTFGQQNAEDFMPIVHLALFPGRAVGQKQALGQALTDFTVRAVAGSADAVDVIFAEIRKHNWASGGGLWSDRAAPAPTR